MAIKIYMEKAFNFMEWNFLINIMSILGFHSLWISWIKECITTVSYSVIINGNPCSFSHPSRCLEQGDSLSPFLFILVTKVLMRIITKEENLGHLEGISISRNGPTISHLFSDDLILFGKTSRNNAKKFHNCLVKYSL